MSHYPYLIIGGGMTAAAAIQGIREVDLASWYIQHSLALTAVLSDLSSRQDQVLSPETRALLQMIDSRDRHGGWLDHLRLLVRYRIHRLFAR